MTTSNKTILPKKRNDRKVIRMFPVVQIDSLPGEWEYFHTGNKNHYGTYKIDIMGKDLGGYGRRRVVVRSMTPRGVGELVQARVMQATKLFNEKKVEYQYLALDDVQGTEGVNAQTDIQVPILSWSIVTVDLVKATQEDVEIIDNSLWSQTIDCENQREETFKIGVLAITQKDSPFIVSCSGKDVLFVEETVDLIKKSA